MRAGPAPAVGGQVTARVLIGTATAAVALLVGGAIKAALPWPPATEGEPMQARVVAVVDGDTLRVEDLDGRDLGRVRLLGIDAPEVAHPPAPADCYADAATDRLQQLAPLGSIVDLATDSAQANRDRYGRILRYVDHAGLDVSRELLAAGAARLYEHSRHIARGTSYITAARTAQDNSLGLWGNC